MTQWQNKARQLNYPVLIFFVSLLMTVIVWDKYLNSQDPLLRAFSSWMVLIMGGLYSSSAAFFAWNQERLVAQLRKQKERIGAALEEKKVLLKEIHDRSKNNLQMISSLLSLQLKELSHQSPRSILIESQNRLHSMALVYEILYESDDLACMSFSHYIHKLTISLAQSSSSPLSWPTFHIHVADISISLSKAVPCGLLTYELLSNSLRHAFTDGRKGEVWIYLNRNPEDGMLHFKIAANGVGYPKNFDFDNAPSFGMHLIRILCKQLQGSIVFHRNRGSEVSVTFPY